MRKRTCGHLTAAVLAACLLTLAACGGGRELEDIALVVDRHADELVAIDGVSAVGLGVLPTGEDCVRIYVTGITPELRALLPKELEGHPVDIEVSGEFLPLEEEGDS